MAVQGKTKVFESKFYVGFAELKVVAINPSREELNKLLDKEDEDTDKEIEYLSKDNEGNERVRLSVWFEDVKTGNLFPHSILITDKVKLNKDGNKTQYVNTVCTTSWTDEEENLPTWFTKFTDKNKNVIGDKGYRTAFDGEEALVTLLRAWFGQLSFFDKDTEVSIDIKKLFAGNFRELQELVGDEATSKHKNAGSYKTSFVALLGVKTKEAKEDDENQEDKQYQAIYGKSFLPFSFIKYINNGFSFPNEYSTKQWNKFKEEAEGDYGPNFFVKLVPLEEYNRAEDHIANGVKKEGAVTSVNDGY